MVLQYNAPPIYVRQIDGSYLDEDGVSFFVDDESYPFDALFGIDRVFAEKEWNR